MAAPSPTPAAPEGLGRSARALYYLAAVVGPRMEGDLVKLTRVRTALR